MRGERGGDGMVMMMDGASRSPLRCCVPPCARQVRVRGCFRPRRLKSHVQSIYLPPKLAPCGRRTIDISIAHIELLKPIQSRLVLHDVLNIGRKRCSQIAYNLLAQTTTVHHRLHSVGLRRFASDCRRHVVSDSS